MNLQHLAAQVENQLEAIGYTHVSATIHATDLTVGFAVELSRDGKSTIVRDLFDRDCVPDPTSLAALVDSLAQEHLPAPTLLHVAVQLAHTYAELADNEFGCCHNAEDFAAGVRIPRYDGDESTPLPEDCAGLIVLNEWLPRLENADMQEASRE